MERIVYNKTLDVHKAGVQFTLHGFETADKMARRIVISLMASGDAIDLQTELLDAVMYVTTPGIEEPSINSCTISGNTIIYDSLPITNEGITIMQLKLIGARPGGVDGVIATPRFAVEVVKSDVNDEVGESSPTYTAIEEAIARSREAYDNRLLRIALHTDCMFYAYYADGTIYESDVLKNLFLKGDVLLSQSFAKGGSGIRDGEEKDNSMYYANVSKSMASEVKEAGENALEILDEVKLHGVYTAFNINFESGEVEYVSPSFNFKVNLESGELEVEGQTYTFYDEIGRTVKEWLEENKVDLYKIQDVYNTLNDRCDEIVNRFPQIPLYLCLAGNVNTDMVNAALGMNNEDMVDGIGKSLAMYARFKEPTLNISETFSELIKCNKLSDFNPLVQEELNKSNVLRELFTTNIYAWSHGIIARANNTIYSNRDESYTSAVIPFVVDGGSAEYNMGNTESSTVLSLPSISTMYGDVTLTSKEWIQTNGAKYLIVKARGVHSTNAFQIIDPDGITHTPVYPSNPDSAAVYVCIDVSGYDKVKFHIVSKASANDPGSITIHDLVFANFLPSGAIVCE